MEDDGIEVNNLSEKIIELNEREDVVSHLAVDIGGSLIKMVYFSSSNSCSVDDEGNVSFKDGSDTTSSNLHNCVLSGKLHFFMFETSKINECIQFISSKRLQNYGNLDGGAPVNDNKIIKATGGGAYKFADLFREKLGIILDKVDEMSSLVAGANFLLKAVYHEAFAYVDGQKEYLQIDHEDLYPYLLVNIGSGVSMIRVDSDSTFQRVSGTSIGGGTFLGLGLLLTKCKSFDELLELSHRGDNKVVDMLVGDIYGGKDYSKIGLASTAIASSFGKPVSEKKELEDYRPEDLAKALLRMISNNIGQIAHSTAKEFKLKRIFFGGFFIRGHAYTMDTISVAVDFWSKGELKALFLRHEGFLGAMGSFTSYNKYMFGDFTEHNSSPSLCIANVLESSDHIECMLQVKN